MQTLYATLAGLGIGLGVVGVMLGWRGVRLGGDKDPVIRKRFGQDGMRLVAGVIVGVVILAATRWVVPAVCIGALIMAWPLLFGAVAEEKAHIRRLEALAVWTEALRDTIATGSGLLEALRASATRPPAAIAGPLQEFVGRLANREPLESSLRLLADDVSDPIADQVISALILNARVQGRQLRAVLTSLAESTRLTVQARRQVEADRRKLRKGVQIILTVVLLMTVAMALFVPSYAEAYRTMGGQIAMAVIMAFFFSGFLVMRRLAIIRTPKRFLSAEVPVS